MQTFLVYIVIIYMILNSYTLSQCRIVCKGMFDLQVSVCYMNSGIYNISTGYLNNPYCYFTGTCVIMNLRKNQTAAKQTFWFSGSLTGKYPAKQDEEHKVRIYKLHVERIPHDRKHRDMN